MARTREWNCMRQIQWGVNQEYKHCWMPRGNLKYPPLTRYKSVVRQDTPKEIMKEIIDSIEKARAGLEVKSTGAAAEDGGSSTSEDGFRDTMIEVVVRAELFAQNDKGNEQMRVDLVVKQEVAKPDPKTSMKGNG